MMPKPSKPREVASWLLRKGFRYLRDAKGSHAFYVDASGHRVMIAFHPRDIPTGTLRKIIRDAGATVEDFNREV